MGALARLARTSQKALSGPDVQSLAEKHWHLGLPRPR